MRWKLNEYPRLIEGGEGLILTRRGLIRVESNICGIQVLYFSPKHILLRSNVLFPTLTIIWSSFTLMLESWSSLKSRWEPYFVLNTKPNCVIFFLIYNHEFRPVPNQIGPYVSSPITQQVGLSTIVGHDYNPSKDTLIFRGPVQTDPGALIDDQNDSQSDFNLIPSLIGSKIQWKAQWEQ